jgi:uncharacterized protein (UPF0305 family)
MDASLLIYHVMTLRGMLRQDSRYLPLITLYRGRTDFMRSTLDILKAIRTGKRV